MWGILLQRETNSIYPLWAFCVLWLLQGEVFDVSRSSRILFAGVHPAVELLLLSRHLNRNCLFYHHRLTPELFLSLSGPCVESIQLKPQFTALHTLLHWRSLPHGTAVICLCSRQHGLESRCTHLVGEFFLQKPLHIPDSVFCARLKFQHLMSGTQTARNETDMFFFSLCSSTVQKAGKNKTEYPREQGWWPWRQWWDGGHKACRTCIGPSAECQNSADFSRNFTRRPRCSIAFQNLWTFCDFAPLFFWGRKWISKNTHPSYSWFAPSSWKLQSATNTSVNIVHMLSLPRMESKCVCRF